jgi:DNA-binding winged helix-turn-helix (wHTH) protein
MDSEFRHRGALPGSGKAMTADHGQQDSLFPILRFNHCELNTGCFSLKRNGATQKVEPRVFDLLVYLAERADRVVPKQELLLALWGTECVSESVLTQCVFGARRAVGDSAKEQRIIATVSKRGYRFVGALE